MGICQLCKNEKKLIEAHIIPKWAFRYLYPDIPDAYKHPLVMVKNGSETRRPIGPYDSNILCSECDGFLGSFDDYGKSVFLDAKLEHYGNLAYLVRNVDFDKLRIFILSVAWRASLSNREEFKEISMGPYEDRIGKILLNLKNDQDIELSDDFSFIVTKFDEGDLPKDVVDRHVQTPHPQKIDGVNTIVIHMPKGLKVYLKIDQRKFPDSFDKLSKLRDGGLFIGRLGNYADSKEFQAMIANV